MTSLRKVALLAGMLGLGLGLNACDGGGGGPAASGRPTVALPTLSATARTDSSAPEPSTSRPSVTLPTRSAAVTPPPNPTTPAATTPAPTTPAPTPTRTAAPPTQTSAPEPTRTSTPAPSPTRESTPSPTSTAAAAAESSSSTSPWVWVLLGLLLAAAVVTLIVLVVRRQRARRDWEARLAGVVAESTWLARGLLPNALSTQGASARRDVWTAYRPRVEALQNNLNDLMASAPTERWGSLDLLRAAVINITSAMDSYAATDGPADWERLGAAGQAQRQLEEALRAFQQPPPGQETR